MEGGVLEVPIEDAGGGQAHAGDCWRLYPSPYRQSSDIVMEILKPFFNVFTYI